MKQNILNGYNLIYKPEHPRAGVNGCVYEHIVVAEQLIGRELMDDEVVHHIDGNRSNNNADNLIVFATKSDHTRYHNGGVLEKIGDHFIAHMTEEMIKNQINGHKNKISVKFIRTEYPEFEHLIHRCPICGKETLYTFCSNKCSSENQRKFNPTKNELIEDLVTMDSVADIGKKYNVVDNTVRKRLKLLGLPYKKKDIDNLKKEYCTYIPSKSEIHKQKMEANPYNVHILTKDEIRYIKEHYIPKDREFGARGLARKFGVAHTTILKHLK